MSFIINVSIEHYKNYVILFIYIILRMKLHERCVYVHLQTYMYIDMYT
jgi:hypothetical protein